MADRARGWPVAKEGLPFCAAGAAGWAGAAALGWTGLGAVLAASTVFTAWFFRNPGRTVPQAANLVVSPGDGRNTPAREGNTYDHRDHQPTQAELGAAGVSQQSSDSTAAVEKEVHDLLKQADRLDRESEEQDEGTR